GILDDVISHAAPLEELHARHDTGKTLIRTRFPEFEPGCLSYGVHRGVLFNAVHSLLKTSPAEVRPSCDIVSRQVTSTGEVWLGDACGGRHGPFDFTIAADGA